MIQYNKTSLVWLVGSVTKTIIGTYPCGSCFFGHEDIILKYLVEAKTIEHIIQK